MRRLCLSVAVLASLAACTFPGGAGGNLTLTATFDDVGDMVTQHSVQMADVRIGSVKKIELTDDFKAKVTLSVKGDQPIPRRSEAVLRTTSLLGEKFIELRPSGDPEKGPFFKDGDHIEHASEAPELEFVTEQAVEVLGAVASTDISALVETGAAGFGGRGPELRRLVEDLASISHTLADSTKDITTIIDGLDRATSQLAQSDAEIDGLLRNLSETTTVLSDNRQRAVDALAELTRLAKVQNEEVLRPFRDDVDRQIKQVDLIVGQVAQSKAEVARLVDWLDRFVTVLPSGIPKDDAQVYSWFVSATEDDRVERGH
jgi:phospholipid/cholesterol/gamma-HCH transport system substrate-binding protein